MALANNITKDLNIEQITPDPVMADPELFCLCGWCTRKAGSSSFVFVYVYSADYQPTFPMYLSHAGGLTADQLIFEVDQPRQPAFSVYINQSESNSRLVAIL